MKTATIRFNETSGKFQAIYNNQVIAQGGSRQYVENVINMGINKKAKKLGITRVASANDVVIGQAPVAEPVKEEFNINERFGFVEEVAQMIVDGTIPSAILSGEGGLGKSYTVLKVMAKNGLQDIRETEQPTPPEDEEELASYVPYVAGDYIVVKGFSTAKGMYRTLYENRDKIVIFDDCDSVLKNETAVNILKAALDSYDRRIISWNSENPFSDLPRSFLFTGRVIFISNLPLSKIDQPILSRSISIDLSMTPAQMMERMKTIIHSGEFLPEISTEMKLEALTLIDENKHQAKELSLRTLISISKIRAGDKADWKRLAKYVLINN